MYFYLGKNKKSYQGMIKTNAAKTSPCRMDVTFNEDCTSLQIHNVVRKGTLEDVKKTLNSVIWYGMSLQKEIGIKHVIVKTNKFPEAFLKRHGFIKTDNYYKLTLWFQLYFGF